MPAGDPVGALPLRVPYGQRDGDERPEEGVDGGQVDEHEEHGERRHAHRGQLVQVSRHLQVTRVMQVYLQGHIDGLIICKTGVLS